MFSADLQKSGKIGTVRLENIMVEVDRQLAGPQKSLSTSREAALVAYIYEQAPEDIESSVQGALRLMGLE